MTKPQMVRDHTMSERKKDVLTVSHANTDARTPSADFGAAQARQVLVDLSRRVDSGLLTYLTLWGIISASNRLDVEMPGLTWAAASLFLIIIVIRTMVKRNLPRWVISHFKAVRATFMMALLGNGLLWGLLTAWLIHMPQTREIELPMIFAAIAFCASGAMVMAICPVLRTCFVGCTLGPIMVSMLLAPSRQHQLVTLMCAVYLIYVVIASRSVHADYCETLRSRVLLEDRAAQLETLSVTDPLTQIHNRLYFDQRLSIEWARALRQHETLAFMVIDLDHFKKLNDGYGHPFGDRVLKEVAKTLAQQLRRATDVLARYGGEEFVVMLPNTDEAGARIVAERLVQSVRVLDFAAGNRSVKVSCSIGVQAVMPCSVEAMEKAVNGADHALYLAKRQGRDRVVVTGANSFLEKTDDRGYPR